MSPRLATSGNLKWNTVSEILYNIHDERYLANRPSSRREHDSKLRFVDQSQFGELQYLSTASMYFNVNDQAKVSRDIDFENGSDSSLLSEGEWEVLSLSSNDNDESKTGSDNDSEKENEYTFVGGKRSYRDVLLSPVPVVKAKAKAFEAKWTHIYASRSNDLLWQRIIALKNGDLPTHSKSYNDSHHLNGDYEEELGTLCDINRFDYGCDEVHSWSSYWDFDEKREADYWADYYYWVYCNLNREIEDEAKSGSFSDNIYWLRKVKAGSPRPSLFLRRINNSSRKRCSCCYVTSMGTHPKARVHGIFRARKRSWAARGQPDYVTVATSVVNL